MGEGGGPVARFRRRWNLSKEDLVAIGGWTRRWQDALEACAPHTLPRPLLDLVQRLEGRKGREAFEREYAAERKAIGRAALEKLEARITIPGAYIHPGREG